MWMAIKKAKMLIRVTSGRKARWIAAAEADARSLTSWVTIQCDRAADKAGIPSVAEPTKPARKRAKS